MKKLISILFLVLISFSFVLAIQPQQSYNKKYLDPLYVESLGRNELMTYNLTVDTPDGISSVENAMITFQVWHNPSIRYYLWVNGQTCNTESFYVSTTYANAGEGTIFFDCSNVITKEGEYVVEFQPDDDVGTVTGWIDLTYTNNPKADIKVHGTEYTPGENAKVWLQLIDSKGDYVNSGACQIDIYTPTNDEYIENAYMTNANHDGIYYYDLRAPQEQGVWPVIAKCFYDVAETKETADGFTLTTGKVADKTYVATWQTGGDKHKIEQKNGAVDFYYSFTNMCGTDVDEELLSGLSINTKAKWTDSVTNDNIILSVYNFTSSSWIDLSNLIYDPNNLQEVTNSLSSNNLTRDGVVSTSGETRIRYRDTLTSQGGNKRIEVDMLNVACEQYANLTWQEVKGSSEMHISSDNLWVTQVESGQVFNDTWPGNFDYNVTLSSQTAKAEEDQRIYIELPTPFPCHHVLNLYVDGVDTSFERHDPVDPATAGCSVEWDQDLNASTNYDIRIVSENYFKKVESTWGTESSFDYDMINLACKNYQVTHGYSNFTIPQTEEPSIIYDDEFMAVCSDYLSTYYHFNKSYNEDFKIGEAVFTESEMHGLTEQWRHMQYLVDRLQTESTNILTGLTTGSSYSTAIITNPTGQPIPVWATYWANISTSYLNFKQLYGLTTGAISVSINETSIANAVWGYTGTISSNLLSQIATNIWSYVNRSLTEFNFILDVNTTEIADAVWSTTSRTLSAFTFDLVDEQAISDYVWNHTTRNLTEYQNFGDQTNYTAIENLVNQYSNNITEESIWNYSNRQLTDFGFVVDIDNELVSTYVWNETTRNLTFFPTQVDLTNYTQIESLIQASANNITEESIWSYSSRNLTFFPTQVDLTNYTQISDLLDAIENNLTAQEIWNYANRNLTYYEDFGDQTNYTLLQDMITQYGNTDNTNYTFIEFLIAQNTTMEDLTNYTQIQSLIVQYGNNNTDLTNYTQIEEAVSEFGNNLTALEIWSYYNRSVNLTNYTLNQINDFEFYIDASPSAVAHSIDFQVYSLLEISQYNSVEGQFSCYMQGYRPQTEIIFNKAISKTSPYSEIKTINFPVGVHGLHRIICELDVATDVFPPHIATDTFMISYSGESPTNETEVVNETEENATIIEQIQNQTIKSVRNASVEVQNNFWIYLTILGGFFLILICFFLWRRKHEKN